MGIARDATSFGFQATGTANLTFSHTVGGGANTLLLVFVADWGGDHVTGVTYNGVAMTQLIKAAGDTTKSGENYIYGILAPAAGAHNVVISRSSTSGSVYGISQSYTGVRQYSLPDSSINFGAGTSPTKDCSVTTVADLCWIFVGMENGNVVLPGGPQVVDSGGTLTVIKNDINSTDGVAAFDNQTAGAKTPAGVYSATVSTPNPNGSCTWGGIGVSFAPVLVNSRTVTETQATTDTVVGVRKALQTVTETQASSDAIVGRVFRTPANQSKSSSSWSNTSKS